MFQCLHTWLQESSRGSGLPFMERLLSYKQERKETTRSITPPHPKKENHMSINTPSNAQKKQLIGMKTQHVDIRI